MKLWNTLEQTPTKVTTTQGPVLLIKRFRFLGRRRMHLVKDGCTLYLIGSELASALKLTSTFNLYRALDVRNLPYYHCPSSLVGDLLPHRVVTRHARAVTLVRFDTVARETLLKIARERINAGWMHASDVWEPSSAKENIKPIGNIQKPLPDAFGLLLVAATEEICNEASSPTTPPKDQGTHRPPLFTFTPFVVVR